MSGNVQPSREEVERETEVFKNTASAELKESTYVHQVYNEIAPHFSQTRYKPWPLVQQFLEEQPSYSLGVDVGCGNGKYFDVNPNIYLVGSDYSTGLVGEAARLHKGHANCDVLVNDGLYLPHPENCFDVAISIAVIHHFSTRQRRQDAIKEILRVLRPKGKALIYCWALEQKNSRRGYHSGMDQDILVPWVLKNEDHEVKMRYYHLYKEGELVEDCEQAGGKVVDRGYSKDNWWAVVEK